MGLQGTENVQQIVETTLRCFDNDQQKGHKIILGLQKAAQIGDIVIQHHPETTALVWAGVRFILQVLILPIAALDKLWL